MEAKIIVFLGGYSLIKGAVVLAQALPRVASAVPGVRCVIAGVHAPSRALVPRLARRLLPLIGLGTPRQRVERALGPARGLVVGLPWRDDVVSLFAAADVLAYPATVPHFARPITEAFVNRVPVVASDIGGVRDIVTDGRTGRLVPAGDPRALARGLIAALTEVEETRRMVEAAAAEARERYDPANHIRQITEIYERLLASRLASRPASPTATADPGRADAGRP